MYKKITHTIVEEHFDHPIASQIKKSLSRSKLVNSEVLSEDKFRTDAHAYFLKYQEHLNSLIDTVNTTDEEFLTAFDEFFKTGWLDELGNMTKPIYSAEFGERLNEGLRLIVSTVFLAIQSIKIGKDSSVFTRAQFIINEIAQNLNNFSNTQWPYLTIRPILEELLNNMTGRAKARVAKNTTLDAQLAQKNINSWDAFEKLLVNGIIRQHPERFSKTPMMTTSQNIKDIM